jgi:hypothetical protein
VPLEGLGQLKKSNALIGIRNRDLPACSIMSQPNTVMCAPKLNNTVAIMRITRNTQIHFVGKMHQIASLKRLSKLYQKVTDYVMLAKRRVSEVK